jgi:predicted enzyme related to lactoylglutathione lyase
MNHSVVAIRGNLEVHDVPASIDFYRRNLELEPVTTMGEPPTFAIVAGGGAWLGICEAATPAVAGIAAFYVVVDDVEEAFRRCQASGAEVTVELTTQPWMMRDFVIRDPDGHQVAIGQRVKP